MIFFQKMHFCQFMGKLTVSGIKSDRKQIAAVLINSENDYSNEPEW